MSTELNFSLLPLHRLLVIIHFKSCQLSSKFLRTMYFYATWSVIMMDSATMVLGVTVHCAVQ